MDDTFLRTRMLLGGPAMDKLKGSHVAVFGLGGVGSYCAEALARSGVGQLTLVDMDTVGRTNINRQLCAAESTIGQYKAEVMAGRARDIDPGINARAICRQYDGESRDSFFDIRYDYIVDAIDLVSCKLDLILTAHERGIPIISSLGTGNKLDPSLFRIGDISETSVCPLARVVRKELKARGLTRHTVLWSTEEAVTPLPLEEPPPGRRSIPASCAWTPPCAGLMLAGFVVRSLTAGLPRE